VARHAAAGDDPSAANRDGAAVSALVRFVFSIGGLLAVTAFCIAWLNLRPRSRRAWRTLVSGVTFYVVAGIPVIPEALAGVLLAGLRPFEASDVPSGRAAIVVLGSGGVTVTDWAGNRFATTDPEASARVLEAVRVFRLMPSALVISSGGNSDPSDSRTPTGESMRAALLSLGVPAEQVVAETEPRNTHEEAVMVGRMLRNLQVDRIVLVTSGVHMRRSLGAFRAVGLDAVPAIARSPEADLRGIDWWLPGGRGLWYSGRVVHETVGIAYYSARGWFRRSR
jgi:uncharacterized SAM-binding protein YcdF (DUF218 family)